MEIDGRCHRGYLSYEATADPSNVAICHCTDCQTLSGMAFRTAIRIPRHDFRMLSGEPTIYVKTTDRGTKTAQAFGPRCGHKSMQAMWSIQSSTRSASERSGSATSWNPRCKSGHDLSCLGWGSSVLFANSLSSKRPTLSGRPCCSFH